MKFTCNRCWQNIELSENEAPWAIVDVLNFCKPIPLCLDCLNSLKPIEFSALGGIPVYRVRREDWKPLAGYSKLATGLKAQELRQEMFGNWA